MITINISTVRRRQGNAFVRHYEATVSVAGFFPTLVGACGEGPTPEAAIGDLVVRNAGDLGGLKIIRDIEPAAKPAKGGAS